VVETLREIGREPRSVERVLAQDERKIAVGDVEQLDEIVLDLDVVVRAREAETRRRLDDAARGRVELADESAKINRHGTRGLRGWCWC